MEKVALINFNWSSSAVNPILGKTLLIFDKIIPVRENYFCYVDDIDHPGVKAAIEDNEPDQIEHIYRLQYLARRGILFRDNEVERRISSKVRNEISIRPKRFFDSRLDDQILLETIRHYRIALKEKYDITIIGHQEPAEIQLGQRQLISCVLARMPVLPIDFDIARVIDFKSDPDTKLKLAALRNWMVDMNRAQYTKSEIEDKFQYLYYQYIDHIERAKVKYTLEGGEFWFTAFEEIVNDLSRMKFGSATKAVFSISKRHLKLLEEELKAPGKELAFIYKARKEFGD